MENVLTDHFVVLSVVGIVLVFLNLSVGGSGGHVV